MQLFLKELSDDLIYISHDIEDNIMTINVDIKKNSGKKIRAYYTKDVKDINFGSYKVILRISCPIYYLNRSESNASKAHELIFVEPKSKMTKRLAKFIEDNMKESSAIGLERTLKKSIADISDSTILRYIKKKNSQ